MEIWYRTKGYGDSLIDPVEVVKSTEKTVTIAANAGRPERRANIMSDYGGYFRTWEEARAHLITKAELRAASARRNLEVANGHLGNVRGMKKPA